MGTDSREKLIGDLASAMGLEKQSRLADTRYDKDTGTFYCNGHMISPGMIDQAINFYENAYQRSMKSGSRDLAMVYELALECIKLTRNDAAKAGKVVIRKA